MTTQNDQSQKRSSLDDEKELPTYEHDVKRGKWSSKIEYFLTVTGYAIGIGNVIRFPFLCYRSGGGAFLIPYFLMMFFCGIPLFYLEISIGQFSSTGCTGMFRLAPLFKGSGIAVLIVNFIFAVYYSVILAYPIRYMYAFMQKDLPFISCNNKWNTPNCRTMDQLKPGDISNYKSPADEYFHHEVLKISSNIGEYGTVVWPLIVSLIIAWIIIYICISKGLHSVGKVAYFTTLFPYVILLIFLIRGVTLPGSVNGIIFYVEPKWKKLFDLKIWSDASVQTFLTLGAGWGGIVNMSSFNKFHNDNRLDAFLLPLINFSTSVFSGFVVFSVIGHLSYKTGIPISDVVTDGFGLAFITYPEAIALLPIPHLWGILFFLMIVVLGIDSIFVLIECIASSLVDEFVSIRRHRCKVTIVLCLVLFSLSTLLTTNAGFYIITLFDWYSGALTIIVVCILELVMVSWNYGASAFMLDIEFMVGKKVNKAWKFFWKYLCLIFLIFVLVATIVFNRPISYNKVQYPTWAIILGWVSAGVSLACIPGYMFYIFVSKKGTCCQIYKRYMAVTDWTPADERNRQAYEIFIAEKQSQALEEARIKSEKKKNKKESKNRARKK